MAGKEAGAPRCGWEERLIHREEWVNSWEASEEPVPCRPAEGGKPGGVGPRRLDRLALCVGHGSVWGTGVVGGPEQVRHDASMQLQDGAHTEQVHDLV